MQDWMEPPPRPKETMLQQLMNSFGDGLVKPLLKCLVCLVIGAMILWWMFW